MAAPTLAQNPVSDRPEPPIRRTIAADGTGQRATLEQVQQPVADAIRAAFALAKQQSDPAITRFVAAYANELARRYAESGGDERVMVPLLWLHTSGHLDQLRGPLVRAITTAANTSLAATLSGQVTAFAAGVAVASASVQALTDAQAQQASADDSSDDETTDTQDTTAGAAIASAVAAATASSGDDTSDTSDDEGTDETTPPPPYGQSTYNGQPISGYTDAIPGKTWAKVGTAVAALLASGGDPAQMLAGITSGWMGAAVQALLIGESELTGAFRFSISSIFGTNPNAVAGWIWQAMADCCPFCSDMDQTFHDPDEDMLSHPRCRCEQLPVDNNGNVIGGGTAADASDYGGLLGAGAEGEGEEADVEEEAAAAEEELPSARDAFSIERMPAEQLAQEQERAMTALHPSDAYDADSEAKARVSKALADRMVDNPDFAQIAQTYYDLKQAELESYSFMTAERRAQQLAAFDMSPEATASRLLHSWASPTDGAFEALQKAIRDEFGLTATARMSNTKYARDALATWADAQPGLRAFVRAMYDNTQDFLKANGLDELVLYRGMGWEKLPKSLDASLFDGQAHEVEVALRPASSFSADLEQARHFANNPVADLGDLPSFTEVINARVPAELILSTPQTGFGALDEYEAVVLGGRYDALMVGADNTEFYHGSFEDIVKGAVAKQEITTEQVNALLSEQARAGGELAVRAGAGGGEGAAREAALHAQVEHLATDASTADAQTWLKGQLSDAQKVSLTTLDADAARLVANATANLADALPRVERNLWRVEASGAPFTDSEAFAKVATDGHGLYINPAAWYNLERTAAKTAANEADGWWVAQTPEMLIGHEVGHLVQLNYGISSDVWKAAVARVDATGASGSVSEYGDSKVHESFAEVFALLIFGQPTVAQMPIVREMATLLQSRGIDFAAVRSAVGSAPLALALGA